MTSTGAPIDDKLNSMTVGPRGPLLMQVFFKFYEVYVIFKPHSPFI